MQPQHLLRYTPRGSRVTVALLYGVAEGSAYGWYVGAAGRTFRAAYFALTPPNRAAQAIFVRSMEDDLYGAWLQDAGGHTLRVHSPLSDVVALDIARLQSAFVAEWLVLDRDSAAPAGLPVHCPGPTPLTNVRIQPAQLERLERSGHVWQYATAGIDFGAVRLLAAHWHIDERADPLPLAQGERRFDDDTAGAVGRASTTPAPQPLSEQR